MARRRILYDDIDVEEDYSDLPDAPDRVADPTDHQQARLKRRVRAYAEQALRSRDLYWEVKNHALPEDEGLPLGFTVTTDGRRTRCGGECKPFRDDETGDVTYCMIEMNWRFYTGMSWEQFAALIRHEMAHALDYFRHGDSGHGPQFKKIAEELDAVTHVDEDTWREIFDHRYTISCTECDLASPRDRASDPVKRPERRMCPQCETQTLEVTHNFSGLTWTDNTGYHDAREQVETDDDLTW